MPTDRQADRQQHRKRDGRYSKMHSCELCGKRAGDRHAEYYSDDRSNATGHGLVLCERCAAKLSKLDDAAYVTAFSGSTGALREHVAR